MGSKKNKKNVTTSLKKIFKYLEEAGFIEAAGQVQGAIDMLYDGDFLDDSITTRDYDTQHARPGTVPVEMTGEVAGGMQGIFNIPEAQKVARLADELDQKGLYDEADELDGILKEIVDGDKKNDDEDDELLKIIKDLEETRDKKTKSTVKDEDDEDKEGVETLVDANGHRGITSIDDQGAGMFQGFSDAYMYSGYGNLEGAYGPSDR